MTGVIPVARCVWFFALRVDIVVKHRRLTSTSQKFVRYKRMGNIRTRSYLTPKDIYIGVLRGEE